jgi:hypothetical protein
MENIMNLAIFGEVQSVYHKTDFAQYLEWSIEQRGEL